MGIRRRNAEAIEEKQEGRWRRGGEQHTHGAPTSSPTTTKPSSVSSLLELFCLPSGTIASATEAVRGAANREGTAFTHPRPAMRSSAVFATVGPKRDSVRDDIGW